MLGAALAAGALVRPKVLIPGALGAAAVRARLAHHPVGAVLARGAQLAVVLAARGLVAGLALEAGAGVARSARRAVLALRVRSILLLHVVGDAVSAVAVAVVVDAEQGHFIRSIRII